MECQTSSCWSYLKIIRLESTSCSNSLSHIISHRNMTTPRTGHKRNLTSPLNRLVDWLCSRLWPARWSWAAKHDGLISGILPATRLRDSCAPRSPLCNDYRSSGCDTGCTCPISAPAVIRHEERVDLTRRQARTDARHPGQIAGSTSVGHSVTCVVLGALRWTSVWAVEGYSTFLLDFKLIDIP